MQICQRQITLIWFTKQLCLYLGTKQGKYESECDIREHFDTNEYSNIFESNNLHEQMSDYFHIKNLTRTNVRINIRIENCANI